MELSYPEFYRVKRGQTLEEIARAFGLPPRVLAAENCLKAPPEEGEILRLPQETGNLYRVRGGESRAALCGSRERFLARNGTELLYPFQLVRL